MQDDAYRENIPQPLPSIPARRCSSLGGNLLVGLLLLAIMLAGGYFRFNGLNWDDFTHLHPDERFLTDVASQLTGSLQPSSLEGAALQERLNTCLERYPQTGGVGPYFDALCSTLNPHNANSRFGMYVYGTLPLFIARGAGELVAEASEWYAHNVLADDDPSWATYNGGIWVSYDGIHLVWRFLSALAEMGVIVIVFLIGVRLHDKWVGLVAAALYALTVFSIQIAHFGTVDAQSNFFAALTILFAVVVQREGGLRNYLWFGIAFGAALASRINLAPLAGLVILAAIMQALPALDKSLAREARERLISRHAFGLVLAGVTTIIAFRLFNPYAFVGPGIFGLSLNPRWLQDMATAQSLVSGAVDSPPNFQWVSRTPYLFPLNNIVVWGMGIGMGAAAWISWAAAGWRLLRGRPLATANILLIAWVLVYFGWLGRNWVTTMRYFLPIYPALVVLAAWGLVSLARAVNARGLPSRWRAVGALLLAGVIGFSLLWAAMFSNVYRNQLTRVQASHWVWENVPGDFAMRVETTDSASTLVALTFDGQSSVTLDAGQNSAAADFGVPEDSMITAFSVGALTDRTDGVGLVRVALLRVDDEDEILLGETQWAGGLSQPGMIPLIAPVQVASDAAYRVRLEALDNTAVRISEVALTLMAHDPAEPFYTDAAPLINIPIPNAWGGVEEDLLTRVTRFDENMPETVITFTAPQSGIVHSIHAPHLGDPNNDPDPETLRVTIMDGDGATLSQQTLSADMSFTNESYPGRAFDILLQTPIAVEAGESYQFLVELIDGGPIVSAGTVFTWEGAWDDPIPTKVCAMPEGVTLADDPAPGLIGVGDCRGLDPWWGLVNGYLMNIVYEDDAFKREVVQRSLDNSDYIAISSNRFYDTLSRNPLRWPMTNEYYKALFAGDLGYDLVATFQETYELGPLRVSDQVLPTYEGPEWLNEFEAEEAFHVYDHPVVFIFQKRADYDAQVVSDFLYSFPLTRINEARINYNCPESPTLLYCDSMLASVDAISSERAARAPTQLQMTDEMRALQTEGGTWSDRFDTGSIVNRHPVLTVIFWWLAVILFGWAAWPLLFALFPALADRGYGAAKFAGMFLVGWSTWYLASARVPVWSQVGIAAGLLILGLIGIALMWRQRAAWVTYLRAHWKRLALIELITLLAFLAFLLVRLTNPDLWHSGFGGEKPMDFAYFNGVLRSTIFPPLDPWHAGGYINYYYFGFVIVGTPVLLLGVVPSVAYNLILPTLFAMTGIGAFSVAFNAVSALRVRRGDQRRRLGNPWLAGIAALMLAVVLGNLDTPRVFLNGLANTGGYQAPTGLQNFLIEEYTRETGLPPDSEAATELIARASANPLGDQLRYEFDNFGRVMSSLGRGLSAMLSGQPLAIGAERWFWAPSRVLAETPGVEGNAITEMPIFTFIYGDMHAHMISMPMQLLIMGFMLNELLLAGDERRSWRARWLALAVGAALVGMLQATNTWDWITYLLFGVLGLGFAWWLAWRKLSRASVIDLALRVGGFVALSAAAALPYTTWFRSAYTRVLPWEGGKSPLWAYFDIHGLFLFLVASLLLWDTVRWLRSTRVRALRGQWRLVIGGLILVLLILAIAVLLSTIYPVALVAIPLLLWIVLLFFRSGQQRTMQFVLALVGLAIALTLGVEIVVLDGDIGRQNTVFKFYLQAWLLLSIAGGAAFAWLIQSSLRWRAGLRNVWMFALVLLVAAAALFPIMATRGKAVFRFDTEQPPTLDGIEFMKYARQFEGNSALTEADPTLTPFSLEGDYQMIRWLQENVRGTPTIIEGQSTPSEYKWNARISIYTGLPSVIGWNWHQRQQRGLEPLTRFVELRAANVNAFYSTLNIGTALDILRHYDVEYVIVGALERAYYSSEALAKFEVMAEQGLLEIAFQHDGSTIYRVADDAPLQERG